MGTVRKILPEFAQNLQLLLQLRDNENLWPSRLSPRFCNPGLWSSQQSSALNEFQFPGFITQPGAGGKGLVVTPKLVRISPCSCQLVHCLSLCGFITCFCGLMSHVFFSTRSVAFPDLLSRPLPKAGGGQLQQACRGSLCVQQSSWEEAGNPLEEGRTSPRPA